MPTLSPILFFTPDPPGAIWQDKPQIARRLARVAPLLLVNEEPTLRGKLPWRDLARPALLRTTDGLAALSWSPLTPMTGAPLLGPLTASLRRRRLQRALERVTDEFAPPATRHPHLAPLLWFFRPGQQHWIEQLRPRLVVYHVVDEYSAYPGLTAAQVQRQRELDAQLTRRADLVFCTAQSLVAERLPLNPHTYYLPNAVDFSAFSPKDLPPSPSHPPTLAVVGGINAKVDLALLAAVAEQRPDWLLRLVGPVSYGADEAALARLRVLPNVHFAGAVPPEQVPAVLAACEVGLIPYRLNEQTRHVNPLKVYEYLAAGRAVVATSLPELVPFSPLLVRLADDARTFVAAIAAALAEGNTPDRVAARRAVAAANTWDHRVAHMIELIGQRLTETEPRA